MPKLLMLASFFIFLITACAPIHLVSNNVEEAKTSHIPSRKSKIAFIFPAGAGAMRVSLAILSQLEKDLNEKKIGNIIDMAGGISAGAILAASLSYETPSKYGAYELKDRLDILMENTFKPLNNLVKAFKKDFGFTLFELNTIFKELMTMLRKNNHVDLGSTLITALDNALTKAPGIRSKIEKASQQKGPLALIEVALRYSEHVQAIKNYNSAKALNDELWRLFAHADFSDPASQKIISYAAHDKRPVFFAPASMKSVVDAPLSLAHTSLSSALMASSAVPGFITAPPLYFLMPDGKTEELSGLKDGVFAGDSIKYDPSAEFFEIFNRRFKSDDLLIFYLGNGSKIDQSFRANLTFNTNEKITFVAIDAEIKDEDGNDIFDIAQFDNSEEMNEFCQKAASRALDSIGYRNTVEFLRKASEKTSP